MDYSYGNANVRSVEIRVRESIPPRVTVTARGELEDACTEIDKTTVRRADHTFRVQIATRRPTDEICAQVLAPFEKTIDLDTTGLGSGVYMVDVNGVTDTFAL